MKFTLIVALLWFGTVRFIVAAEERPLNPHLQVLQPLLEKTWKGTFKNSTPEKPVIDVQKWERALNGRAVRALHSINDGAYGGETLFIWDDQRKTIVYYYFTTEGYMTTGTMNAQDGKFTTHEDVKGDADGVTEVRSTCEILPDGKFHVKAEYLKKAKWTPGHEVTYEETAGANVIFK